MLTGENLALGDFGDYTVDVVAAGDMLIMIADFGSADGAESALALAQENSRRRTIRESMRRK